MQIFRKTFLGGLAVLALAAPATAQELATEVVEEYFAQMTDSGLAVSTGSPTVSGSTVEWKDVTLGLPEGAGTVTINFIRAEELGGGKVSLSYPEVIAFTIDPEGEQPVLNVTVTMAGVTHIVSGAAAARVHDTTAANMTVLLASADNVLNATISLSDTVGTQVSSSGDVRNYKGTYKAADLAINYSFEQDGTRSSAVQNYANIVGTYDVDAVNAATVGDLLNGSRNMALTMTAGSTTSITNIDTEDMKMQIDAKGASSSARYGVVAGAFDFNVEADAMDYKVTLPGMPLPPFEAQIDKLTMAMAMPTRKTDAAEPARIQMGLTGVKASDTIWGMIDPAGSLPRDKANINLDLSAQVKWLTDLMMASEAKEPPIEVSSVEITDITVEIAGAALNGSGSATIDNSTMPPVPVGAVDLDLKGGIGLVDKLMAIGLLPQEQGQMVKMMSGMFTVPGGDGPDHLVSKIEMQEGGAILANGNRIK